MKLTKLEEARIGQRVAKDVFDPQGTLLFPAGTRLTPELAEKLRRWKVTHLFMDEESTVVIQAQLDPLKQQAAVDKDLDHMFAQVQAHPVMAKLREAAARYLKARPS